MSFKFTPGCPDPGNAPSPAHVGSLERVDWLHVGGRNEVAVYYLFCARNIHYRVCLHRPEMLQLLRRLQTTLIITSPNLHKSILRALYWFAWPEGVKAQVAFFLLNLSNRCLIATILFLVTVMAPEAWIPVRQYILSSATMVGVPR